MNKKVKNLLILSLACLLVGGVLFVGVYALTGIHSVQTPLGKVGIFHHGVVTLNQYEDFEAEYEQIESLEIECNMCSVNIETKDIDQMIVKGKHSSNTELEMYRDNDTLIVSMLRDESSFTVNEGEDKLTIYVPNQSRFKDSILRIDMGEIDVEGITLIDSEINIEMGEADLENVVLDGTDVNTEMGGIDIEGKFIHEVTLTNTMGSTDIELIQDRNEISYTIEASLGSIVIDDEVKEGMDTHLEYIAPKETAHLNIENSMGSVSIDYKD